MKKPFNINSYLAPHHNINPYLSSSHRQQPILISSKKQNQQQYQQYFDQSLERDTVNNFSDHYPIVRTRTTQTIHPSGKKNQATANFTQSNYSMREKQSHSEYRLNATQRNNNDRYNAGIVSETTREVRLKTSDQYEKQLQDLIQKLKDIKHNLQAQIYQLQRLLNQTSQHIDKIDIQFQKIKFKIIDYVSRTMDASLKTYKKNMTKWSKYEEIQKKGLEVAVQMKDFIKQQETIVQTLKNGRINSNLEVIVKENLNRITHYNFMTKEIAKVKEECIQKKPTLHENNISNFQKALQALCSF